MSEGQAVYSDGLDSLIREVHGLKVMLDADLARVYGVTTKRLNEQVRRNQERFPSDFAFQLTAGEFDALRSQIATLNDRKAGAVMRSQIATASGLSQTPPDMRCQSSTASKRNIRFLPWAFTEHGAIMAANVLNSPRAAQMSVFVVRAFVKMRGLLGDSRELARKLAALEKELKERLDVHEAAIVSILQRVLDLIDPPALPEPPKKRIGFQVKEPRGIYQVRRKKAR
jgi:hypothetical protein